MDSDSEQRSQSQDFGGRWLFIVQPWARSDTIVFPLNATVGKLESLEETHFCTTPGKKFMSLFGSAVDTKVCTTECNSHNLCTTCVRIPIETSTTKEAIVMLDCLFKLRRKVGCALQWSCAKTEGKPGREGTRGSSNQKGCAYI